MQQTYIISPLKSNPQCITYVRLEDDDSQPTVSASDAVLIGDEQGYVTLVSVDAKDLKETRNGRAVRSDSAQDRNNVYVDPKNLIA